DHTSWHAGSPLNMWNDSGKKLPDLFHDSGYQNTLTDSAEGAGTLGVVQTDDFPVIVKAWRTAGAPCGGGDVLEQAGAGVDACDPVAADRDLHGAAVGMLEDVEGPIGGGRGLGEPDDADLGAVL